MAATALANGIAQRHANRVNQKNYDEVRNYNRPSAQMARYRAAGLNPNLIYTQSNEADLRPEWKAPQFDFNSFGSSASSELQGYQNIKESKSRVENIVKTNDLIDKQIVAETLKNDFQALVNNQYNDLTELQKEEIQAKVAQLYKGIEQMDKQIELISKQVADISKQWSFKSRELQLQNARLVFDRLSNNRSFMLALKEFGLKQDQFEQMKYQFDVDHQFQTYMLSFIQGITGNENPKDAAKYFGAMIKSWIQGEIGGDTKFDHSENEINDARKKNIPYRKNGKWVRPWDNSY